MGVAQVPGKTAAMFVALVAGIALTLIVFASPPPASAASGWIPAINISPQVATDDSRYVAFQRRNRVPVVLDTRTGDIRSIRKAWACQPRDIASGGRVLLICPHERRSKNDSGFRAKTASVRGGAAKPLFKTKKIYDALAIGDYWIPTSGDGPIFYSYLNWRTGRVKNMSYRVQSGIDLDVPYMRWAKVKQFTPNYKGYPNPFWSEPIVCRGENVVISDWKDELLLWTDPDHSVRIGRGDLLWHECSWYTSIRFGSNWVTWKRGPLMHAYNYRTGQRFNRRFTPGSKIAPLDNGLVVAKELHRYGKFYKAYRVKFFPFGGRS